MQDEPFVSVDSQLADTQKMMAKMKRTTGMGMKMYARDEMQSMSEGDMEAMAAREALSHERQEEAYRQGMLPHAPNAPPGIANAPRRKNKRVFKDASQPGGVRIETNTDITVGEGNTPEDAELLKKVAQEEGREEDEYSEIRKTLANPKKMIRGDDADDEEDPDEARLQQEKEEADQRQREKAEARKNVQYDPDTGLPIAGTGDAGNGILDGEMPGEDQLKAIEQTLMESARNGELDMDGMKADGLRYLMQEQGLPENQVNRMWGMIEDARKIDRKVREGRGEKVGNLDGENGDASPVVVPDPDVDADDGDATQPITVQKHDEGDEDL